MKCTAPCFPKCENEATGELLTLTTKTHLGFNCDVHLNALRFQDVGNLKAEYSRRELQVDVSTGILKD